MRLTHSGPYPLPSTSATIPALGSESGTVAAHTPAVVATPTLMQGTFACSSVRRRSACAAAFCSGVGPGTGGGGLGGLGGPAGGSGVGGGAWLGLLTVTVESPVALRVTPPRVESERP